MTSNAFVLNRKWVKTTSDNGSYELSISSCFTYIQKAKKLEKDGYLIRIWKTLLQPSGASNSCLLSIGTVD